MKNPDPGYVVAITDEGTAHRLAHRESRRGHIAMDGVVATLCGRSNMYNSLVDPHFLDVQTVHLCQSCGGWPK